MLKDILKKIRKKKMAKKNKERKKSKISKEMSFAEILQKYPETVDILLKEGMSCVGCPLAMQESLQEGAIAHGINPEKLVNKLNKKLKQKRKNGKRKCKI
jgi:hybrid cluster-associated redox disulfide protein